MWRDAGKPYLLSIIAIIWVSGLSSMMVALIAALILVSVVPISVRRVGIGVTVGVMITWWSGSRTPLSRIFIHWGGPFHRVLGDTVTRNHAADQHYDTQEHYC